MTLKLVDLKSGMGGVSRSLRSTPLSTCLILASSFGFVIASLAPTDDAAGGVGKGANISQMAVNLPLRLLADSWKLWRMVGPSSRRQPRDQRLILRRASRVRPTAAAQQRLDMFSAVMHIEQQFCGGVPPTLNRLAFWHRWSDDGVTALNAVHPAGILALLPLKKRAVEWPRRVQIGYLSAPRLASCV
ncbi:MAG: hypothetical protein R3E79_52085 [Caldilineaceae bacterium]